MIENIQISGSEMQVRFGRFNLESYDLFLRCKRLPEGVYSYDWKSDAYTFTAPARYASQLEPTMGVAAKSTLKLSAFLFDYQKYICTHAIESKRFAIYADCGLGKTPMGLEWIQNAVKRSGARGLIMAPLQVVGEILSEALKFYGPKLKIDRIGTREELIRWCKGETGKHKIGIVNYEKLIAGDIPELRMLGALWCDESSILKGGGGTIKWNLIHSSKGIEYKLSTTATPAPNDIMEYASQAGFLEKLKTPEEILWTFFSRDKAGEWIIKPHAKEGYYKFLSSWSIYIRNPASYGFKDNLAVIPAPRIHEHRIPMTAEQIALSREYIGEASGDLFGGERMGITGRSKLSQIAKGFLYTDDKKEKGIRRVESLKPEFVANLAVDEALKGRKVLIWTVFNEETAMLEAMLKRVFPLSVGAINGNTPAARRDEIIEEFKFGRCNILIGKTKMLGFGLNLPMVKAMIFSGWDDSYEKWYQGVRRSYRYGQTEELQLHIPLIFELEGVQYKNILWKAESFEADAALQEKYYRKAMGR